VGKKKCSVGMKGRGDRGGMYGTKRMAPCQSNRISKNQNEGCGWEKHGGPKEKKKSERMKPCGSKTNKKLVPQTGKKGKRAKGEGVLELKRL